MRIESRQKITYYDVYIAKDGKEFNTREDCINHEKELDGIRKVCPTCNGAGWLQGKFVPAYDNYDIGHVEAHYEWDECPTCHGKKYLEKKVVWE